MTNKWTCMMCGKESPHGDRDTQENCRRIHNEWQYKLQARKDELYWALRTRVLTSGEMEEVRQHDYSLLTKQWQSYSQSEVQKTFNDALLQQFMIRLAAEKATAQ